MSGPTAPLDPAPLEPAALDAALDAAREAFAAAGDLDALKAARLAHVDKGAIAAARREIGALPPAAKAEAGKLVGAALDAVRAAYTSREEALQAVRDERILVEERVDVTMPTARRPLGARHPIELTQERLADILAVVRQVTGELAEDGISERELAQAKTQLRGQTILAYEGPNARMSRLGSSAVSGEERGLEEHLNAYDAVTADEVQQIAQHLFDEGPVLGVVGPKVSRRRLESVLARW